MDQNTLLSQIQIVLVETSHTGNIGSTARAMKTMGLERLRLVAPKQVIDEQAEVLSAGAKDILDNAKIFDRFEDAIADCQLVIGTSARLRHLQNTLIEPRKCGELAIQRARQGKIAFVFGRERIGLTNDELLKCHYHLNVPTNPEYGSLNLAMAVQIVSYEIRMAWLDNLQKMADTPPLAVSNNLIEYPTSEALEHFFKHTEHFYRHTGFIHNDAVMQKIRRLYLRTQLQSTELNLLQGMLSSAEKDYKRQG